MYTLIDHTLLFYHEHYEVLDLTNSNQHQNFRATVSSDLR